MVFVQKKISGGKLVKIEYRLAYGGIKSISITGDFFLHPEDTLLEIEKTLLGRQITSIAENITYVLEKNSAELIGVTAQDIQDIIVEHEQTLEEKEK